MKKKIGLLSLAMILVLSIFVTACNSNDAAKNTENKVTLGMFSAPSGVFNPVFAEELYDNYVNNYVFGSLWHIDANYNYVPEIAEKWEFSPDHKFLTIHLRKDVKWHDGQPVTADDMIFTWNVMASPDYTGPAFDQVQIIKGAQAVHDKKAKTISGATKLDDYTIKVEFEKPIANALDKLWITPIPKHVFEKIPVKDMPNAPETKTKIVGNGPYKIKEIKPNEYVVLEKNKDYFIKGKPYIDTVVWKVVDPDVAVGALKDGEIDVMTQVSPDNAEKLKDDPNLAIVEQPDFGYQYLGLNTANPKLQDVKLRQAIAYAINRKALVDGLLKGHGYVLNQAISKASWAYNADLENKYPYDVNKAKQLLAEAGYKDVNGDGYVEDKNGKPFELTLDYPTGNEVRMKSAPIIVEDLKKAGIRVKLNNPRDVSAHYDAVEQGKVEMFLAGWAVTNPDPDQQQTYFSTSKYNYSRYKNPKSDELLLKALYSPEAFDREKRKQIYKEWTELYANEVPIIFLYSQNRIEVYNKRIEGVKPSWNGIVENLGIIDWKIKK